MKEPFKASSHSDMLGFREAVPEKHLGKGLSAPSWYATLLGEYLRPERVLRRLLLTKRLVAAHGWPDLKVEKQTCSAILPSENLATRSKE